MRKKIFIIVGIFCFITLIIGLVYWQTMIANYLTSVLSDDYDLTLSHNGLSFSLQGDVVIEDPQIADQQHPEYQEFLKAESFGVGFNIQNVIAGKMPLKRVRTDQFQLNLQRLPDGSLHLARVIQRFVPGAIGSMTTPVIIPTKETPDTGRISTEAIPSSPLPESTTEATEKTFSEDAKPQNATNEAENNNVSATNPTTNAATTVVASAAITASNREFDLPEILLNNSELNYENNEGVHYQVDFERFQTLPDILGLEVEGGIAWRKPMVENPLGTAERLKISEVFRPGDKLLGFDGNQIDLNTRETEPGRYDMRTTYFAWKAVIDEIADQFKPQHERENPTKSIALVETLNLTNVKLHIHPLNAANDENVISIEVGLIKLVQGNDLSFHDVKIFESNKPTLSLNTLSFTGLKSGDSQVSKVEGQDITLNIREGNQDILNVNRVISHVQSLIDDFIRKDERVASATPTQASFWSQFNLIAFSNVHLNYEFEPNRNKQMSIGSIAFQPDKKNVSLQSWLIKDPHDEQVFVDISKLDAIFSEDDPFKVVRSILSDNVSIKARHNEEGISLTTLLQPWLELPKKLKLASHQHSPSNEFSTNPNGRPFQIRDFKMQNTKIEIIDMSSSRRVVHRFDPVQLEWQDMVFSDAGNQEGKLTAHMLMQSPSNGEITIRGTAAPSVEPCNAKLVVSAKSDDITGFRPYMPNKFYTFEQGGIKIDGDFTINNDFLNTTFDIVLLDPQFQIKENNLSINAMTMQRALNGMKNNEGNIILPNNQLTGNIKDPQFRLGTGIFEIITRNLLHSLTNIPGLAFDVAGFGANVVTETVKTIGIGFGSVLNNILGGETNNQNQLNGIP